MAGELVDIEKVVNHWIHTSDRDFDTWFIQKPFGMVGYYNNL